MPRRSVLTDAQAEALSALPTAEADRIRHYTRSSADTAIWLLPIAVATTSGMVLVGLLMEEPRRRTITALAATIIERLVATALLQAERHVGVRTRK